MSFSSPPDPGNIVDVAGGAFNTNLPGSSINSIDNAANFKPFTGDPVQSNRLKAYCQVTMAGVNITSKVDPHLISVHIIDGPVATCDLELDDRDATLPIPPFPSRLQVSLGWDTENSYIDFDGTIQDIEHGFGRKQGGRRMFVHAEGADMWSNIKSPFTSALGVGDPPDTAPGQGPQIPLPAFLAQVGAAGGGTIIAMGSLASVTRSFWHQDNESMIQVGQRLANELGAVFRVTGGTTGVLVRPNEVAATSIICQWGVNLIGWRVRPVAARGVWGTGAARFYDVFGGQWKTLKNPLNLGSPWSQGKATYHIPSPAPNSQVGTQANSGTSSVATNNPGDGKIIINGEPRARWLTTLAIIIGARPGVDGAYRVWKSEHIYNRQGYLTWLDVWPLTTSAAGVAGAGASPGAGFPDSATGPITPSPIAAPALPPILNPDGSITNTVINPDGSTTSTSTPAPTSTASPTTVST